MKIAAIYDIHGNLPALEAVLAEIKAANVDQIVVGGDVVAGPMPSETLACLQQIGVPTHFIHGNAESELLRVVAGGEPAGLSPIADQEAYRLNQLLSAEEKAFIATWATTVQLNSDAIGPILFCHGTPTSDVEIFTAETPTELLIDTFAPIEANVVVCGHTHMQFDRTVADVRVVNAGSVGMPFGATGAYWLLIAAQEIAFQCTHYDASAAAARIRASDAPNAEDFANNNILQAPPRDLAMQMLNQLEARQRGGAS